MKIIKFGGKSLSNGKGFREALSIIEKEYKKNEEFVVVVSARGEATDELLSILKSAKKGKDYNLQFQNFKNYQQSEIVSLDLSTEFEYLDKLFKGVTLVSDYSTKVKNEILAQGEIISAKTIIDNLKELNINAEFIDSRNILTTDNNSENARILHEYSEKKCIELFSKRTNDKIPVVTGFIASDIKGETSTLGRNGSNYTASLLANYLDASLLENYTHVDGIYTADPVEVKQSKIIEHLSFQEANELAVFGTSVLHENTISPLIEKEIPLKIKNTFNSKSEGTIIDSRRNGNQVKAISTQKNLSLIVLEGKGLFGKTGIDSRIFNSLAKGNISIGVISQGSSERGVSFVVNENNKNDAVLLLKKEFHYEILNNDIDSIFALDDIAVITIIGQRIDTFFPAYKSIIDNNIKIHLLNNTFSGKNISIVLDRESVNKAVNIIHSQIFGVLKNINIAVLGKGNVSKSFIRQLIEIKENIEKRKEISLRIFAIANSKQIIFNNVNLHENWEEEFDKDSVEFNNKKQIIDYAKNNHLENLVLIDNTSSEEITELYTDFIKNGFDLISSNKHANTKSIDFYDTIRSTLRKYHKQYLYETNVGAGLPLIDTIKLLHESGENITRIRGVFSGSLSYIFNEFSEKKSSFSTILKEAVEKGYTENDPREDLSGADVARKLLVLARELELKNEFEDIQIDNLIHNDLTEISKEEFLSDLYLLDDQFDKIKESQKASHVLRYLADLHGDLQKEKGLLDVKLVSVPKESSLGQLKGSDSLFEIYTESYGENPIMIQGAGAGAKVTARGVLGDLLRIAYRK